MVWLYITIRASEVTLIGTAVICEVTGAFRHETEELFPSFDEAIARLWDSFPREVFARGYLHDGCSIELECDFTSIAALQAERLSAMRSFRESPQTAPHDWWEVSFEKAKASCRVTILGANELSMHGWYPTFFFASHLYDLFLILNLALPGSMNLYSAKVSSADSKFSEDIDLSSFYFEDAWVSSNQGVWPPLKELPVITVAEWFYKVRPGFNQIPETPIERAFFALLHICGSNGRSEDIVWLFYAMESLFETRAGENFAALFERTCLVLNPPEEVRSRLKKELRKMYDYRSAFVHGGLKVIHPHHREVMDKRVDQQYDDIVVLSLRWTHILVACLQKMAENGWTEIKFLTILEAR